MLFKQSIQSLFICCAAGATACAQTPLWFEQSETPKDSKPVAVPNAASGAPSSQQNWLTDVPWSSKTQNRAPKSPAWIELNRVELVPAPISKTAEKTEASSEIPRNVGSKQLVQPTIPWAAIPSASPEARKPISPTSTSHGAPKAESADSFIKRAELQLRKQQSKAEQATAPESSWMPKPSKGLAQPSPTQNISTKMTEQALLSGVTADEFRWPSTSTSSAKDHSYLAVAASKESAGESESLIVPTGNMLALWQDDDSKSKSDKESKKADDEDKSEADDTETSKSSSSKEQPKKSKFDTASMVGPLTDSGTLFSMLAVDESFQTYAAPVQAMRTRDMDSQMQAAFTSETYTWVSPVFYHKPLYFEQPNLERYGNGSHRWLQPVASSVHFFGTIPLLPYKVLTQHPCEKYYTLGNRRPGNCNPVQRSVILGQSYVGEVREYWRPGSGY